MGEIACPRKTGIPRRTPMPLTHNDPVMIMFKAPFHTHDAAEIKRRENLDTGQRRRHMTPAGTIVHL